jgi:hypothetical protein
MPWPLSQDYNESLQIPSQSFGDPELRGGRAALNALGLPLPRSGNFADVYQFEGASGAVWAVKCFTREVPGLQERYREISKYLAKVKLPFAVDFTYLPRGIKVQGRLFPILKMPWVDGCLLNEFVRDNLDKPARLEALLALWVQLGKQLRAAGVAHGDLQHGNVILQVEGGIPRGLRLVDLDGMYVPALAGIFPDEAGHPSYQHPQRIQQGIYNAEADRLSLLLVACALRSLAVAGKGVWDRYDNGDNLLFQESDLREPSRSAVFKELWNLSDASAHDLVGYLALGVTLPYDQVPLLDAVLKGAKTVPLTAAQEEWVTRLLGPGARERPPVAAAVPASPEDRTWWKSWQ